MIVRVVAIALLVAAAGACTAAASPPVRVTVAGRPAAPVAGRAWTIRLAVRPPPSAASCGSATGPSASRRVRRAAAVDTARRSSSRPPAVDAHRPRGGQHVAARLRDGETRPAPPVTFTEPTSIELSRGTLLLVENNPGRCCASTRRPGASGSLASLDHPYAVVALARERSSSRSATGSSGSTRSGGPRRSRRCRIRSARSRSRRTATSTSRTATASSGSPAAPARRCDRRRHGVLPGARPRDRARRRRRWSATRTAAGSRGSTRRPRRSPRSRPSPRLRGIDVAPDGTLFAVASATGYVEHFSASGAPLGERGPAFLEPYDLQAARGGGVYLLEAGAHRLHPADRAGRQGDDGLPALPVSPRLAERERRRAARAALLLVRERVELREHPGELGGLAALSSAAEHEAHRFAFRTRAPAFRYAIGAVLGSKPGVH